jgi:hypothetical protein
MIMSDDNLDQDYEPDHREPDPDSLGAILAKALVEVDGYGGADQARLAGVIGKDTFNMVNSRRSTKQALDRWLSANPAMRPQATKMLAMTIAKATETPHLVDRIAREIDDSDLFYDPQPPSMRASPMTDTRTKVAPRRSSDQLEQLARNDDITAYRNVRLRPRNKEAQRRHGV